jgi:integrase
MPKQLTQIAVDRMRPDPTKRLEIPDHLLPALRLVLQPSGKRSWAVRTRIRGQTAKVTLGDARVLDLAKARAAARATLIEVAEGNDPRPKKRKAGAAMAEEVEATTLGGVAELYLRDRAAEIRPKTLIERQRHLRRDWRSLHDRPLVDISRREIAAHLMTLKDGHGPIAANRSRATLHALYEWALEHDLVEVNPVAATKPPTRREPARDRVLSLEELQAIWRATAGTGDYDAVVRLLTLSGQRREEVAGMRWRELDLPRRMWLIPAQRAKNGRAHKVPLSPQMIEIITTRPRSAGRDRVFGEGAGGFSGWSRSKVRLDRRSGVSGWTLHDLRRSFVTHLNELGVAPAVIEAAVNHVSGVKAGIAGTYNRAEYLKERTRALQAWADQVTGAADHGEKVVPLVAAG